MKYKYVMYVTKNKTDGYDLDWDIHGKISSDENTIIVGGFNTTNEFIDLIRDNGLQFYFKDECHMAETASIAIKSLARKIGLR